MCNPSPGQAQGWRRRWRFIRLDSPRESGKREIATPPPPPSNPLFTCFCGPLFTPPPPLCSHMCVAHTCALFLRSTFELDQPFIGVATAGVMKGNVSLTGGDQRYPVVTSEVEKSMFVTLDPNHSHYVLIDKPSTAIPWSPIMPGVQNCLNPSTNKPILHFGTEIATRGRFEEVISTGGNVGATTGTASEMIVPLVTLVYGGGPGTMNTVLEASRNRSPVIVLKGSGRFADVLHGFVECYKRDSPISNLTFFSDDNQTVRAGHGAVATDPGVGINKVIRKRLLGQDVASLPNDTELAAFRKALDGLCEILTKVAEGKLTLTFVDLNDEHFSLLQTAKVRERWSAVPCCQRASFAESTAQNAPERYWCSSVRRTTGSKRELCGMANFEYAILLDFFALLSRNERLRTRQNAIGARVFAERPPPPLFARVCGLANGALHAMCICFLACSHRRPPCSHMCVGSFCGMAGSERAILLDFFALPLPPSAPSLTLFALRMC